MDADGGEENTTYAVNIYAGFVPGGGGAGNDVPNLGSYDWFNFDYSASACKAIGNPAGCGRYISDSAPSVSNAVLDAGGVLDKDSNMRVAMTGGDKSQASDLWKKAVGNSPSGDDGIVETGSASWSRVVCGNLYPLSYDVEKLAWDSYQSAGALTCIGSGKSHVHNYWYIGGSADTGDGTYGWQPGGVLMWESFEVEVSGDGRDEFYLNKDSGDGGTKERTNQVTLSVNQGKKDGPLIDKITYTESTHFVSPGQPWGGTTTSWDSGVDLTITIKAGRHGTSNSADYFLSETDKNVLPTATNTDEVPGKLNLVSCGTLDVTLKNKEGTWQETNSSDVCFGQGHTENPLSYVRVGESGNNWWMGGKDWSGGYCLESPSKEVGGYSTSVSVSPDRGVGESQIRDDMLFIMPTSNGGVYSNPDDAGLNNPLCPQ